jgi:hypothetical protein
LVFGVVVAVLVGIQDGLAQSLEVGGERKLAGAVAADCSEAP